MADILLAAPSAKFGQPEVNLGTITGGGGSQRLAQAVGKSRAMELTLTGRVWTAQEAVAWGMASRIAGEGEGAVVREAIALAAEIAGKSQLAVQAQKEAVNSGELHGSHFFFVYVFDLGAWGLCAPLVAFEQGLSEGLRTERRLFHMTFATADQKEGALRHPARNPRSTFDAGEQAWRLSQRRESQTSPTRKRQLQPHCASICIYVSQLHRASSMITACTEDEQAMASLLIKDGAELLGKLESLLFELQFDS